MINSPLLIIAIVYQLIPSSTLNHVTADDLDRKLGPGAKHLTCQVRVTGFYMKRHCRKHFNTTLACGLTAHDRLKVNKIAKLCCEDASACHPATMFSEFCCLDGDCENTEDCQPWDNAVEEFELANLIFSSDHLFNNIQHKIIEKMKNGEDFEYLPDILAVYNQNPYLIPENEPTIKRYLKAHRLQTAHIAKSIGLIDEHNRPNF